MTHRKILKLIKKHIYSDLAEIVEDFMMDFQCLECNECFWDDKVEARHKLPYQNTVMTDECLMTGCCGVVLGYPSESHILGEARRNVYLGYSGDGPHDYCRPCIEYMKANDMVIKTVFQKHRNVVLGNNAGIHVFN